MVARPLTIQAPVTEHLWPYGGSETASLLRSHAFATDLLDPPNHWPQSLRTTVDLILGCQFPMVVLWGPRLVQVYNDGYRALMGSKHPAGLGQATRECWPEVWHLNEPVYSQVWQGHSLTFENQLFPITRHGYLEDAYFTLCYSPVTDESGSVAGILVTVLETTGQVNANKERARSEAALRHSEERLRLALSAANIVGIWHWDVPNNLIYADRNFADVYGVSPVRATEGASLAEFVRNIHPDDLPHVQAAIDQALQTHEEYRSEYRIIQADGSTRWVSARGRCLLDQQGAVLQFLGVTIDISQRKQIEDALRLAEKLTAVGRLASSIAHEINNPLEAVINLHYLMQQSTNMHDWRMYLASAQEELSRVAEITTQTLRFHKQSTQPAIVLVPDLVNSVLALYKGRLASASIAVERRFRGSTTITFYEGDLRQVLNNLIGNSFDAMRESSRRRLLVRSHPSTHVKTGRKGLRILVADSGTGMTRETLARVFEPFFSTKGIGGTGLGLWVSLGIMTERQGSICVRTSQAPGRQGTAFSLFIPAIPAE